MKKLIADMHMHTLVSGHAYGTIREMAATAGEKSETDRDHRTRTRHSGNGRSFLLSESHSHPSRAFECTDPARM